MTSTELQAIRRTLCLTQAQLAESLNKSVGTIARWERKDGKHPIPELAVREINRMLSARANGA